MLTTEQESTCVTIPTVDRVSISLHGGNFPDSADNVHQLRSGNDLNHSNTMMLFHQVQNSPASWAERFPRLTFCAVAFAILLTALTAEIEFLRGSGYYWH